MFSWKTLVLAVCLPCSSHLFADSLLELDPIDAESELSRRAFAEKMLDTAPVQFALPVQLQVSPKSHGQWLETDSGRQWRLTVRASGATDLNFGFKTLRLPTGAQLEFLADRFADKRQEMRYGPYSSADTTDGQFWSPPLPGDTVTILLSIPTDARGPLDVELSQVGTGFRDLYKLKGGPGLAKQGACNNDVVCPVGDGWRDQIRSVAAYTVGGVDTCTGTMVMDARRSFRPYFLTAWHCGVGAAQAPSVVTIWNYESAQCGDLSGGSRMDTVSGARFVAGRADVDATLLELSSTPPESYNVYWAGWDRSDVAPTGSVGIHHPGVDEKAISFNVDPLTKVSSCIAASSNTHWEVDNWEDGTTERGSSGSALFDPDNQLVIGFLSGGSASCTSITEDCYGRMGVAWSGGSSDTQRLGPWLDPDATGVQTVAGSDPLGFGLTVEPGSVAVCSGEAADYDISVSSTGGFADPVSLSLADVPPGVATQFSNNPVTPPGNSLLTVTGTGALSPDSYGFSVAGSSGTTDISVPLTLIVSDGAPASPVLTGPVDGATGTSTVPTLSWNSSGPDVEAYFVQLATDPGFASIVESRSVSQTTFQPSTPLEPGTVYYWRVRAENGCGISAYTPARTFTTRAEYCSAPQLLIPDNNPSGVSDPLLVAGTGTLSDLSVRLQMTHTWVGDLIVMLRHESSGLEVTLLDRPGVPGSVNGCGNDNVDVTLSDAAQNPVESACDTDPAISGELRPQQPLSTLLGQELAGDWTLSVSDNAGQDLGTLDQWCLLPGNAHDDNVFANGFELPQVLRR